MRPIGRRTKRLNLHVAFGVECLAAMRIMPYRRRIGMSLVELDAVLELVKPGMSGYRLLLLILYAVLVDHMRELQKQVSIIVLILLVPVWLFNVN